jgi:hypothetical protein
MEQTTEETLMSRRIIVQQEKQPIKWGLLVFMILLSLFIAYVKVQLG